MRLIFRKENVLDQKTNCNCSHTIEEILIIDNDASTTFLFVFHQAVFKNIGSVKLAQNVLKV